MKTSAYVKELQAQSVEQLQAQLVDAKKELFNLRFQNATNQMILRYSRSESSSQNAFSSRSLAGRISESRRGRGMAPPILYLRFKSATRITIQVV